MTTSSVAGVVPVTPPTTTDTTLVAVRQEKPKRRITLSVVLLFFAILWMIPLIGLLITSFRPRVDATSSGWWTVFTNLFGQNWTAQNFVDAFTNLDIGNSLFNSLAVAIPATVLPIMFAAFAAYAFTFLDFKGREVYFAVVVGLLVVPIQIAIVPILQAYVQLQKALGIQIVGTFPAAWIIHSAFALPLAIYILRNYMATLPVALIEAARVDGASHFQIFWRLIIPMSVPALASFAIFQFLWVWNDFLIGYLFVGQTNPVLTVQLYQLLGQYGDGWQKVAAGSFITILIPLIVFFSLQRFFVRGLTAGSVK